MSTWLSEEQQQEIVNRIRKACITKIQCDSSSSTKMNNIDFPKTYK